MIFVYSRVSYLTYVSLQISCRVPLIKEWINFTSYSEVLSNHIFLVNIVIKVLWFFYSTVDFIFFENSLKKYH